MNPHQNININISYNLGNDKASRPLPAKKIVKSHKPTSTHPANHNCDIDIKLNRKNNQNNLRKSNEYKSVHEPKKSKKKTTVPTRNTITPDMFLDRRIKTEGPSNDIELYSAFKKEKTANKHHRSIQAPIGKQSQSTKKHNSQFKMSKTKQAHVTSCTVPNWKKTPLQFTAQHIISQVVPPRKKRTQSHSTFIKNDKVVSKLLNMSMLASELGGSQPITSQRRGNSSTHSKMLKEYMSSMDMRIISRMQEDVPIFADKKEHGQADIIKTILRTKEISLEELTRKVILIQRKWRQKSKTNVMNQYQQMFQQIASKLKKNNQLQQISGIEHSPSQAQQIFQNTGLVSSIKKEQYFIESNSFSNHNDSFSYQLEQQNMPCNKGHRSSFQEQQQQQEGTLNLKKCRELVANEIEKNKTIRPKQQHKQQIQQWNSINKQITNIMNYKGNLDSQLLMDELIKQSRNNQQWINNQFQEEKREQSVESEVFIMSKEEYEKEKGQEWLSGMLEQQHSERPRELPNFQDSLEEEEEDNQYDHNKYQSAQPHPQQALTPSASFQLNLQNVPQVIQHPEPLSDLQPAPKLEQVWIGQQVQDNVVRNYLDCGLNDFGININQKIINIPKSPKSLHEAELEQLESADESIGARFQEANYGVLKREEGHEHQQEPQMQRSIDNNTTDELAENIVRFLISEFASDISIILKKTTVPPPPPQRKAPPKPQGIPTNFNDIADYLSSFITFILKQDSSIQMVVDTINKDIGPSSLQILTYLRPQSEDGMMPMMEEEQQIDEDEGLFVVSAELYQGFEHHLEQEYKQQNQREMGPRMKAYLSFWHRCIFESYNQCLDYERPYGIQGKPYEWTTDNKKYRQIKKDQLPHHLRRAQNRLLDLTSMVGGLIFQKADSPFSLAQLSQQQRHMMNEQRLSRILATELLQSQQSWINYNDEMAQLLVELSRLIEQKLFFEHGTELKKLHRRRKLVVQESIIEEAITFNIQQL